MFRPPMLYSDEYVWNPSQDDEDVENSVQEAKELWEACKKNLSHDVEQKLSNNTNLVNRLTTCGHTALTLACKHRCDEAVIVALLRCGFDPTIKEIYSSMSAVQYAVAKKANYPPRLILKILACCPEEAVLQNFLQHKNNFNKKTLYPWREKKLKTSLEISKTFVKESRKFLHMKGFSTADLSDGEETELIVEEPMKLKRQRILNK